MFNPKLKGHLNTPISGHLRALHKPAPAVTINVAFLVTPLSRRLDEGRDAEFLVCPPSISATAALPASACIEPGKFGTASQLPLPRPRPPWRKEARLT